MSKRKGDYLRHDYVNQAVLFPDIAGSHFIGRQYMLDGTLMPEENPNSEEQAPIDRQTPVLPFQKQEDELF